MKYNEQELLSIELIKSELHSLCTDNQSGDLCLFTEEKHAAVITKFEPVRRNLMEILDATILAIHLGKEDGRIPRGPFSEKLINVLNTLSNVPCVPNMADISVGSYGGAPLMIPACSRAWAEANMAISTVRSK